MKGETDQIIEARSDVDSFSTIGQAIDEALLRAEGDMVFVHSTDNSQPHDIDNGDLCFCNPSKIEGHKLK
jgi:hypothetical protein